MKKLNFYMAVCLGLLFLMFFTVSCHSTRVISSWSIDPVPQGVMKKILVLSVMPNREQGDQIEQVMANELIKANIDAHSAVSIFGPKGFKGLSEEQITEKLRGSSYTSVMIVSLQDKEVSENYYPGTYYTSPRVVGYNRYYRRYLVIYDRMYTPGHYATNTNYILEADIYTVNYDDQLVYSAQTRSYDPNSPRSMAQSFSKSIITELKEKGIIPN